MPFLISTAPGRADHPNEDFAAVTGHCAVLLDGVSGPPDGDDGCSHGVARHARRLGGLLLAGMDAGLPLRTALAEAIAAAAALHSDTCDLTHRDTPSATVVAVRLHPATGTAAPGGGPPRPDGASAYRDDPAPAADGALGGGSPRSGDASAAWDAPGSAAPGGGPPRPGGASAYRDALVPAAGSGAPDGAPTAWGAAGPAAAGAPAAPGGGASPAPGVGEVGWLEYLVLSDSVLLVADPRPVPGSAADSRTPADTASARRPVPGSAAGPFGSAGAAPDPCRPDVAASARRPTADVAPGRRDGVVREVGGVGLVADTRLDVLRDDLRRRGAAAGEIRALRGVPGGFWTAGADPRAADEALTGTARLDRFALMTDGATRAVEVFGDLDWGQAFSLVSDKGPAALIERVRALEDADPQGRARPRGKVRDDATVVSWVPEELAP